MQFEDSQAHFKWIHHLDKQTYKGEFALFHQINGVKLIIEKMF